MRVDDISLEEMISILAEENHISTFTLAVYAAVPSELDDPNPADLFIWDLVEVRTEEIWDRIEELKQRSYRMNDHLLGLTSKIKLEDGKERHLFMLDFSEHAKEYPFEQMEALVAEAGVSPGFLLHTGGSFHYYGSDCLQEEAWKHTMKYFSTKEDFIDYVWTAKTLEKGYGLLRLTTNVEKPQLPRVVAAFGYQPCNPLQLYLFDKPRNRLERV